MEMFKRGYPIGEGILNGWYRLSLCIYLNIKHNRSNVLPNINVTMNRSFPFFTIVQIDERVYSQKQKYRKILLLAFIVSIILVYYIWLNLYNVWLQFLNMIHLLWYSRYAEISFNYGYTSLYTQSFWDGWLIDTELITKLASLITELKNE